MTTTHRRNPIPRIVVSACLLFAASSTHAAEPLALKKIMKDLGNRMQIITDGISREDWSLVEKTAAQIVDQPQPTLNEKVSLLGFMGTQMWKFKAYEGEKVDTALALGNVAKAKDGPGVILAFQKLQTSCYNCHSEFRKPFVEYFYGRKEAAQ
jgi:cytochrome c556